MSRAIVCLVAFWAFALSIPSLYAQTPARDKPEPTGTAVIKGRIVDAANGQPVRKARVHAANPTLTNGRTATTDVDGRYELKTLPAGRYTVTVTKTLYVTGGFGQTQPRDASRPIEVADGQVVDRIDVKLSRAGIVAGRITDEFGEPMASVTVAVTRFQFMNGSRRVLQVATRSTNDIGEFRLFGIAPGQYYLSATMPRFQMAEESTNQPAYAPTYYPGTGNLAEAQRLTIVAGQVIAGMNMTLLPVRGVRVSGTVVDSAGRPAVGASVTLSQPMTSNPSGIRAPIKPDGTFSIGNVTPGEYQIRATIGDPMSGERALMPLTVGGGDLADVALVSVKATPISGRIVIDRAATGTVKPGELRLNVAAVRPEDIGVTGAAAPTTINDDFTFQLRAWPGRMTMGAGGVVTGPVSWMLKAVRLNGSDVTDSGFDVGASPVSGVEVEMTNVVTEVSGTVTDAAGQPVRNAWVVVFPQDRDKWRSPSRSGVVASRPDPANQYRARVQRSGALFAVAVPVDALESGEWADPDLLDRLRERAIAFEIGEGERKTLNLALTSFER